MKALRSGDATLHYLASDIKSDRQTLVFVNSLGTDFRIWLPVVDLLSRDFNFVLHDKRGHGLSSLGKAPHKIETYAQDLSALLDSLGVKSTVAVGLSVGGLVVQSLYQSRPDLVAKLVISNSAVKIGTHESWGQRIAAVESAGIESFADSVMEKWFSAGFHKTQAGRLALYRNMLARSHAAGYIACCNALRDADYTAQAQQISVPSLFIVGDADGSTPPALVQSSAGLVPNSRFEVIVGAAHIPCVEDPTAYAQLIRDFAR